MTETMDRRDYDTNGWFTVESNPLSKIGVYQYLGRSIDPTADPDRLYNVYRPAEELSTPETIDSFKLLPWIDDHVMLGSEEVGRMPAERKGIQGIVGEQITFDGTTLRGNIKCLSEAMANLIASGKKELSCGYACRYEKVQGVFDGTPYEYIQRGIRGNHLALVDSGRMGPEMSVLDHATNLDTKEPEMAEEKKDEAESKGMTLDEAKKHLSEIVPLINEMKKLLEGDAPKEEAKDEAKEEPKADAKDADADADEDESDDEGTGMDAAEITRKVEANIAEKAKLYATLSTHIGAFDHSEMDIKKMAEYGCKKLNIAGDITFLRGYLAAKPAPTAAMDAAQKSKGNFVTRHLKKD